MCAIELIDLKRIKDKNSKYLLTYFKHYYSNNTNHICYESQRFQKKHKLLYRVVFFTGPPKKMTKRLEPPTFRLTAERASQLRHGGLCGCMGEK